MSDLAPPSVVAAKINLASTILGCFRDKPFKTVVGTGGSHGMEMDDSYNPLFVAVPDKVMLVQLMERT